MTKPAIEVTIGEARASLSDLVDAALSGREVVITRRGKPVAKLVPMRKGRFKFGILRDELLGPVPDFLEPMPEDELRRWEGDERDREK